MKFQLITVEYTGLQFIKGFFNPKPKRGWTAKLIISKFADFVKMEIAQMTLKNKT